MNIVRMFIPGVNLGARYSSGLKETENVFICACLSPHRQNVCINDDDFVIEGDQTPVPPESGCPRPKPPPNSHLRVRPTNNSPTTHALVS